MISLPGPATLASSARRLLLRLRSLDRQFDEMILRQAGGADPRSLWMAFGGWGVAVLCLLLAAINVAHGARSRLSADLAAASTAPFSVTPRPLDDAAVHALAESLSARWPSLEVRPVAGGGLVLAMRDLGQYGSWLSALDAAAAHDIHIRWEVTEMCVGITCGVDGVTLKGTVFPKS